MSDTSNTPILGPGDDKDEARTVPVSHPNYDAQREDALRTQQEAADAYTHRTPGQPIARIWLYDGQRSTLDDIVSRDPSFIWTGRLVGSEVIDASFHISSGGPASFSPGVVLIRPSQYIVHELLRPDRWFVTDAIGVRSYQSTMHRRIGHTTIEFVNCKPPEMPTGKPWAELEFFSTGDQVLEQLKANNKLMSQLGGTLTELRTWAENGDAQRNIIIKHMAEIRDNADMQMGALVGNTATIAAGIADIHDTLEAIRASVLENGIDTAEARGTLSFIASGIADLPTKADFDAVFEVGMENGSTVGNHSILSQMRHCLRIVMEAVEGHPGIVVGQDFRDGPEVTEDLRPRAIRVTLTPGNVRAILANFKASENKSIHVVNIATAYGPIRATIGDAIIRLASDRQEVWGSHLGIEDAYPDAVWLDEEAPEPSDDRKELDEHFARQTGAARPASEATLPDEKITATPEQVAALEKRQRDLDPRTGKTCVGNGDLEISHTRTLMTPMPHGWVCPACGVVRAYSADELPDVSRSVQEEAADARRAHDEARSAQTSELAQNRKPVPLAPMKPLPEYDMTAQLEAAFKAFDFAADLTLHMASTKETGVKSAIIKAINAFNEKQANVAAEQIMEQMAALDGPSNARLSTSFKDGMWTGMNIALRIVRGEV